MTGSQSSIETAASGETESVRRRGSTFERVPFEPSGWNRPAADGEGNVFAGAAQLLAGPVRPTEVGGHQAASLDVGVEVGVHSATCEVVEDDSNVLLGTGARHAERHGGVEPVNHDVVEGASVSAAGRCPVVHHLGAEVGQEFVGG